MKRILAMALSIALIATLAISGTVAYLTDKDDDVNVFTVGNVVIDQREWQRTDGERTDDNTRDVERLDEEGRNTKMPLYPAVITGDNKENVRTDSTKTVQQPVVERNFDNYVDKMVDVENIGKSDAYVRTIVAIPTAGLEDITSTGNDWIHFNWNNQTKTGDAIDWVLREGIGVTVINGERYQLYEFTYQPVLTGTENTTDDSFANFTTPSLLGVWMDSGVDFDVTDKATLTGNYVYNGKTLEDISSLSILVASQACQSTGFYDAATALNASFGATTITNHPFVTKAPSASDATEGTDWSFDAETSTYTIKSKTGLYWFADQVNNNRNTFEGQTVALASNITFDSTDVWTPIGIHCNDWDTFHGTFDGKGHTITGLNVHSDDDNPYYAVGFFCFTENVNTVIKNVTFKNASIYGQKYAGVAVGYMTGKVDGVRVENSTVTCKHVSDEYCGQKAGAIVGFFNNGKPDGVNSMTNSTASNCAIKACREAGMLVGTAKDGVVENATCPRPTTGTVESFNKTACCNGADNHNKYVNTARVGHTL